MLNLALRRRYLEIRACPDIFLPAGAVIFDGASTDSNGIDGGCRVGVAVTQTSHDYVNISMGIASIPVLTRNSEVLAKSGLK